MCCIGLVRAHQLVVSLRQLAPAQLEPLLSNALTDTERGMGDKGVTAAEGVISALATLADGDARSALNALELAVNTVAVAEPCEGQSDSSAGVQPRELTLDAVRTALQKTHLLYDRNGEQHYNIISALHKSMRGSDPDAALYWCGRMLQAGENPRYITRRLIRFASEDIGLADPNALLQAVAADTAAQAIGMPEASVVIGQCVAYLSLAPKSVAITKAMAAVEKRIQSNPNEPVPHVIRNAPTKLMKQEGYGSGYIYPPDHGYPIKPQGYLPESMVGATFLPMEAEMHCPLIAQALRNVGISG
jgi:putative ATPase